MNKKRKINIWIITSFLWVLFLFAPIVYYAKQVRFPVVAPGIVSKIVITVLLLLPIIFAVAAKITKKEKIIRTVFIVCTILNLVSIYVFTFGFKTDVPFFYPIVSYTDSAKDYLVLDTNIYAEEDVSSVFPKKIPEEAIEVKYNYYCEKSSNTVQIIAEWILPNEDYIIEKNRLAVSNNTSYDVSSFAYNLKVEFDDKDNKVCYIYEQGDVVK